MALGPMLLGAAGAGGPAGGAAPKVPMPGSMSGGPSGPGASPMTPVGAGGGNEAMARSVVKAIMPALLKALGAFQVGSREQKALMRAYSSLTGIFGQESTGSTVPAALLQLAQMGKGGATSPQTPPPPIQSAAPPPIPGVGAGAGGEA